MMVFEDEVAKRVALIPPITQGDLSQPINFDWGTEEVLMKYLALKKKKSFPLIWLVEDEDSHEIYTPSVSRRATFVILYESQSPDQFNPYQHEFAYNNILQPVCDNFLKVLQLTSLFNRSDVVTQRIKNYSMRDASKTLVYICNAIVFKANIKFQGGICLPKTIDFND